MKRRLIIFSCYDGISCCQIALHRAGIHDYVIYTSEIDPVARKITMKRWPNTIELGDIRFIDPNDWRLRNVDIIFGGSPCQSMSAAGPKGGITTTDGRRIDTLYQYEMIKAEAIVEGKLDQVFNSSALYWEFVRLYRGIKKYNPNVLFLLENVANKKWENLINMSMGIKAKTINSSLVSAQNRERNYWTNIPLTPIDDRKIYLNHVIPDAIAGSGTRGVHKKVANWRSLPSGQRYDLVTTVRKDRKANCITTRRGNTAFYRNKKGKDIKITVEQAEALQNLPIGYTDVEGVSMTKRWFAIGNGWTVNILTHFFENIYSALEMKEEHNTFSKKM